MKNKILKWTGIAVLAFVLLGVIAVATDDGTATASETNNSEKPGQTAYQAVKEETIGDDVYFRVTIDDRYEKKNVIEILRKLKEENSKGGKVVAGFYIKQFSENGAWVSAAYLPGCDNCAEDDKG